MKKMADKERGGGVAHLRKCTKFEPLHQLFLDFMQHSNAVHV